MPDVRDAARLLLKRRGFTVTAVLTLALGIGATTAILGAARTVLVAGLPFPGPERLIHVGGRWPGGYGNFSYPDLVAMEERVPAFDAVAVYQPASVALTGRGEPIRLSANFVSPIYFELLGVRPAAGRLFDAAEAQVASPKAVAILSEEFWGRQFGRAPEVIGSIVHLNGRPFEVVGVAAPFKDLSLIERSEPVNVWVPVANGPALLGQQPLTETYRIFWGVARLVPGVTLAEAREQLASVAKHLETERPSTHRGYWLEAQSLGERIQGPFGPPVVLLLAGAALLMLIGCVNVASLLLARLSERRPELALRAALGASTSRLVGQLLVESLLLTIVAAVLGLLVAVWATGMLEVWVQERISVFLDVGLDGVAFLGAAALSAMTLVIFGLAPAFDAARVNLRDATNQAGARHESGARRRIRSVLVACEVGFAVMLLVGAGLMVRSLQKLSGPDVGFRTARLLTFRLDLTSTRYQETGARIRFADAVLDRAREAPGVESASLWGPAMLANATWVMNVLPDDRDRSRPEDFRMAFRHSVNPGALGDLGIPIVAGRDFSSHDTETSPLVAIASDSLAREFWPGQDPLGRRLVRNNPDLPSITIVGVARDVRHRQRYSLGDIAAGFTPQGLGPQRDLYLPYPQRANTTLTIAVRTTLDPVPAERTLRGAVAAVDRDVPVYDVRSLDHRLKDQNATPRAVTLLMAGYAAAALVLAMIGVYGLLAYSVGRRTREIGIRVALGATASQVIRLVWIEGLAPVAAGALAGVGGGLALARLMRSLLYDVSVVDPITLVATPVVLIAVAVVAIWGPVHRASRVDPLVALRSD